MPVSTWKNLETDEIYNSDYVYLGDLMLQVTIRGTQINLIRITKRCQKRMSRCM